MVFSSTSLSGMKSFYRQDIAYLCPDYLHPFTSVSLHLPVLPNVIG